jgi:hypothetical protein
MSGENGVHSAPGQGRVGREPGGGGSLSSPRKRTLMESTFLAELEQVSHDYRALPEWQNPFRASRAGPGSRACWITIARASRGRALGARKAVVGGLNHRAIGDQSGESVDHPALPSPPRLKLGPEVLQRGRGVLGHQGAHHGEGGRPGMLREQRQVPHGRGLAVMR